jgi:hypothetical protein
MVFQPCVELVLSVPELQAYRVRKGESKMTRKIALIAAMGAVFVAAGARVVTAQNPAATVTDKQKEKKLAAGEAEAKQMLLLMDRDQNGKVSREEFMNFMEAEFDRLDINKDGELDVKELTQSRLMPRGGVHR